MDVYKTDEEQIESLRKWWEENGTSVVFGLLLGLGVLFGWRWWQQARLDQGEAASALFQNLMETSRGDDTKLTRAAAQTIVAEYGSTAYALFAKLLLAKLAVEDKDYGAAEQHLRWALDNSGEQSISHEIRLRLARVLVAREAYQAALNILNSGDPGQFAADYSELRGDISIYQGDTEGARLAYQEAIANKRIIGGDTAKLELKLDDLGHPGLQ